MTRFFIQRPIFTISSFLLLIFAGIFAYNKLELMEYPTLSGDTIMISTSYPGADSSTIESMVTTPIEMALQGIDGVDYINSTSSSGSSKITINLQVGADENTAVTEIETSLSSVLSQLPSGVQNPIIKEADSGSMPDLMLSYTSQTMSAGQITDYIMRNLETVLSNVQGVGEIQIMGDRQYAMRIWLDPYKMRAYGITGTDVENALSTQNVQATPGELDRTSQVITIKALTDGQTVEDFQNLIVKKTGDTVVRLRNIATVKLGAQDTTKTMFTNGTPAVGLAITYKNDANPVDTAKLVKDTIDKIKLPNDLDVQIIRDTSTYVHASIEEVIETFFITVILVILIVIAFLGSLRLAIIPSTAIPLSLCGTFLIMYFIGFSINLLTMLAFVLAIGLVVDDAIVVMENIHRHMLMGKKPLQAAIIGIKELVGAVIGITITLLAVFAPIGLDTGITGALFKQFAFTLAAAVLVSGVVALFFTPMLCSKVITTKESAIATKVEHFFDRLAERYKVFLNSVIHHKKSIVMIVVLIAILGGAMAYILAGKSALAPNEDQGVLVGVAMGPSSARVDYTQKYTNSVNEILKKYPQIENNSAINGFPFGQYSAMLLANLKNWDDRDLSAQQLTAKIMPQLAQIPGLSMMFSSPPALPVSKGIYNFQFVVKTMGNFSQLSKTVNEMVSASHKNSNIQAVQVDLHIDQPQLVLKINKTKANYLGVSMSDIANTLSIAFGQPENNEFVLNGYGYYVIPQVADKMRGNQNIINVLTVKNSQGESIPLSTVVSFKNEITSASWPHFQGQRSATISAQLASGYSTEQGLTYFKDLFNQYKTQDMSYDTQGQTRSFLQSQSSIVLLFIAALVVIFLVLSAQYESFIDPLVILFTVPLALASALIALYLFNYSLNIYTEIGLITLIGLITKHGILLVDFARQHQQTHQSTVEESIIEAASIRLKPVLMTTLAMVFGALPLLLASGAGAHARNQLGLVIFAGMLLGTLFTLIILPTIYCIFRSRSNKTDINQVITQAKA
ncbi:MULTISPECIES: efflux RND transporter permease subunit [Cysteiniphilum]|uniref:efflux RND transporter permease subunit n=1 Tax=Cysteiniphilum TaxID=2056696 RepID=UPI001CE327EE|nr:MULTISPECIES: efflux RND transporter permease subunit [Cysteiniphilum]